MGQNILLLFGLFGCIGLFLYGMRVMSQGVLKIAGPRMRASLRGVSHHRFQTFGVGAWITSLIQSSSAMTVMTVSLVNAGFLTVKQSISIVMGANVGTTITAWMIALCGYWIPMGYLAIPVIAFTIPFMFSSRIKRKPIGECLTGFALTLLGFTCFIEQLPLLHDAFPHLQSFCDLLAQSSFWSILLFWALGIFFTTLFQSSAATIMLALVFCAGGWISFPMAAAMVIGDNVGTTLTAIVAARNANVSARRAAYAHLFFNLFGMLWALPLVYPVSNLMLAITPGGIEVNTPSSLALAVSMFHTGFNLITSLLLIGFVPYFDRALCMIIPVNDNDEEEFHLKYIRGGLLSTSELTLVEARKETVFFGERVQRMFEITCEFIHMPSDGGMHSHTFSRIEKYEKITDRLELEIVRYLKNMDISSISGHAAQSVHSLYRAVDELESIGDSCYHIARTVVRRRDAGITFTPAQEANVDRMLQATKRAMDGMLDDMHKPTPVRADMEAAYAREREINTLRNTLREENIGNVQRGDYTYQSGTIYMDLITECEKLGDFIINVLEARHEQ
jgi:phosphate:Na+ symporter